MKVGIVILLSCFLFACNSSEQEIQQKVSQSNESRYVAKVADEFITEDQLFFHVEKLTGLQSLTTDQKVIKENVLESMILAKLMAKKQRTLMSEEELTDLELDVASYREERLAEKYIYENVQSLPPSSADVEQYYNNNLHRFGGGIYAKINKWQLGNDCQVENAPSLKNEELRKVLKDLNCDKSSKNEVILLSQLASQAGVRESDITKDKPLWVVKNKNQTVLLVETIEKRTAKPLVEVAPEIQKMLAPVQFKAAITKEKSQLLKEMEVEIFDK